jgi:hypothetical protein
MKFARFIACCIVTCLALTAWPKPRTDRVELGGVEQCRTFPVPEGYRWSQATVDAFCAGLSWMHTSGRIPARVMRGC